MVFITDTSFNIGSLATGIWPTLSHYNEYHPFHCSKILKFMQISEACRTLLSQIIIWDQLPTTVSQPIGVF
jgi:hypothetical protein